MIVCITSENLNLYGKEYFQHFKLRHHSFMERQNYKVKNWSGLEYDQFDTPAAVYLVYKENDCVLGASRLTPTTQGCMLEDLWPELVDDKSNFNNPLVWEGTRFCVDESLPALKRREIVNAIACAYVEFGLSIGIKKVIGMMPTFILRSVFTKSGIDLEMLGDEVRMERQKFRAAAVPVSYETLSSCRRKIGKSNNIMMPFDTEFLTGYHQVAAE